MSKTIISSQPDTLSQYLKKIWDHRSLIVTLAKRDIKVKYAQTVLGLAWTILQPLTAVAVYTLFFSVLLRFETEYPYVLFVLSGVLLWGLFNYIFSQGSMSIQGNYDLVNKLYFPKIILPLSKVLVGLTEFIVIAFFFVLMLLFFQVKISMKILWTPLILLLVAKFSLSVSLVLAAATTKNRDLNHIVPFLINFGIWFTPVFYPVTVVPNQFKELLYVNPMASYLQLFRWCFFNEPISKFVVVGIGVSFFLFLFSFFFFKKVEDTMIDVM